MEVTKESDEGVEDTKDKKGENGFEVEVEENESSDGVEYEKDKKVENGEDEEDEENAHCPKIIIIIIIETFTV